MKKNRLAKKPYDFNVSQDANALLNDLQNKPHAFVLAALMDRQLSAEKAWELPVKIKELIGNFEIDALGKISLEEYKKLFSTN